MPAALVLVAALCGSGGVTASQNVPGSGLSISWLMREIVMLVPTSLYVVGSFMLLSPAASAWYRARKAPVPWAAPVTWGPQYGMPPSHGTTGQNPRQREGRRNDRW